MSRKSDELKAVERSARTLGLGLEEKRGRLHVSARKQSGGPIAGATATIEEYGQLTKRVTVTRLVALGIFAPLAKKKTDTRTTMLSIHGAEGWEVIVEVESKHLAEALRWVAAFNTVAAGSVAAH